MCRERAQWVRTSSGKTVTLAIAPAETGKCAIEREEGDWWVERRGKEKSRERRVSSRVEKGSMIVAAGE